MKIFRQIEALEPRPMRGEPRWPSTNESGEHWLTDLAGDVDSPAGCDWTEDWGELDTERDLVLLAGRPGGLHHLQDQTGPPPRSKITHKIHINVFPVP